MSVTVNTNVTSIMAQNSLTFSTNKLQHVMNQLSSGVRIVNASDDAAGLSIATGMAVQISGNTRANNNISDGSNLLNVAEGGMSSATDNLQRIRELCVQAANETYSGTQKNNMLVEIKQRLEAIDATAETTTYNGVQLLNGTENQLYIQVGANTDVATNAIDVAPALSNIHTSVLGGDIRIDNSVTGETWDTNTILDYIDKLDVALGELTSDQALIGAYTNRLTATSDNLVSMNTNLQESKSRIMDTDIASASSDMVKYQILQQTSASILTQANQMPSLALSLLG